MTDTPLFQDTSADALRARVRIEAFNADYANCIDSDRLEDWPEFFAQDGVYRVTTRENSERGLPISLIYARGRGMLTDRIVALRITAKLLSERHPSPCAPITFTALT